MSLEADNTRSNNDPSISRRSLHTLQFNSSDRLLFISDLHLEAARPDITQTFFDLLTRLEQQSALPFDDSIGKTSPSSSADLSYEALFILGDFFEVWIGDDHHTPLHDETASRLRRLADTGMAIYFVAGNRDFLLGDDYCHKAGMIRLEEPSLLLIHDEENPGEAKPEYALMHGDALCTDDHDYIAFRTLVRDPQWQQQFLAKSIEERASIARAIRQESQNKQQKLTETDEAQNNSTSHSRYESIMDVSPATVLEQFESLGVRYIIHGHTHRPAIHKLNREPDKPDQKILTRAVLGDWDQQAWAMTLYRNHLQLIPFPLQPFPTT